MKQTRQIERSLGSAVRHALPGWLAEFVMFGLKMGWAALFGGLMLGAIILSKTVDFDALPIHRYDTLFLFALLVQALFLVFRLETLTEAKVILLFHLTGTAMEWFKVGAGSWGYPEPALFKLLGVPLFSGFMYASVGSFIARVIRIFDMSFAPYPRRWVTFLLAALIYVNFFSHHYLPDIRWLLIAGTVVIFGRTWIGFTVGGRYHMPMPVAALLSSFFLWVAENIGTLTGTWVYAGTAAQAFASLSKMGSWYLLLYVAFVTVTVVVPPPGKTR
ncbi:DUF817 domain-containing protein [Loktanella sp. IMCC34160]|uniref:DUF817 domain-containing protein n=1 Tax=Loktanella sp. IMCC34160 TaxID=2510646 RepID=UPI00101DD130|nr:DUF817 domain-containing protein [Loktanella sp. IMCC34160]RYG89668.1 DUF817 domain-containing protein [Loktanella sp. IMCC34160]